MARPASSWVSMDNLRRLLLPMSKLPVPDFFQCHFLCPRLGQMEETITGEDQIFHCGSSVFPSGKDVHIWVSKKCDEELDHSE